MYTRFFVALLAPIFLVVATLVPARAADPLKKPTDFRGIKWGVASASQTGLSEVDRDGDIIHYARPGEKKELGGIPLKSVTYSFYKDQFYHAEIDYEGEGSYDALQESLVTKYGPPDAVREKKDPKGHPYEVAIWNWPGFAMIGNRHDKDSPRGRIFYFYGPLTDASAKAQGIAPTPDVSRSAASLLTPKGGPKAATASGDATYPVKKGDCMERIAKQLGVSEAALSAANNGLSDKTLKAGATINVPAKAAGKPTPSPAKSQPADNDDITAAPKEKAPRAEPTGEYIKYTVKDGDILSKVAQSHGVRTRDILAANPGMKPDALSLGTVLKIPVKK
jgi:LysM repeat protein